MSASRIAQRYAKSLLDLAVEQGNLDQIAGEVKSFLSNVETSRELELLLESPIVSTAKKIECVEAIYGGKVSELFERFLKLVVRKRREGALPDIAQSFVRQYNKRNGIGMATVTVATEVSDDLLAEMRQIVLKNASNLKTVEFQTEIDPSIIGGFILEFDDQRYDASVASQLKTLKQKFSVSNSLN